MSCLLYWTKQEIDKSGAQESTACPSHEPPAGPLELHLALKTMRVRETTHYRVLGSEVCVALPRDASRVPAQRFFCAICSHRLLARSSPRGTNVSARGPLSRVVSQCQVKNAKAVLRGIPWHCDMTRKRLRDEGVERECLLQPDDSDRTEKFHHRRARSACGAVLHTLRLRGRDFSRRDESQGGRGGLREGHAVLTSTPDMSIHLFFSSVYKNIQYKGGLL